MQSKISIMMHSSHPNSFFMCLMFFIVSLSYHCKATIITMATANTTSKQGCPRQCGNVTIPYPFGIGSACSINPSYSIFCDQSFNPNKPFLVGKYPNKENIEDPVEILDISETRIRVRSRVSAVCFNSSGKVVTSNSTDIDTFYMMSLPQNSFSFSQTYNKLVAIGCRNDGSVFSNDNRQAVASTSSSCSSFCSDKEEVVGGRCDGVGCCQASVPRGLTSVDVFVRGEFNKDLASFNPCGYAFMAEQGWFTFGGVSDLNDPNFVKRVTETVSVAIEWVIGNGTCAEAQRNPSTYACMGNTTCSDQSDSGTGGYKCTCTSGFQGNPYLSPGCTDIDECADEKLANCSMACENTVGSFRCPCPDGYIGDGTKNGTGCTKTTSSQTQSNFILKLSLGISSGILFIVIGLSWLYVMDRKKKLIEMKKKFFEKNGGWLLQEQLLTVSSTGNTEPAKIFTEEELKTATNNFDKEGILGSGGYGTVYKGILPDNREVAIKKSKVIDQNQIEQFINEVVILGQINHRNVVKLLGCCLETEVPLLVYEFISEGTLYSHIHESQIEWEGSWEITWSDCLRIASEAADALAYLHSAASPPIIHRDIKSMNILLDDHYTAKIADFGASRLIPMDQSQLSTLVQGTLGYLVPEYFHSSLLTEKSDVYSFGVLLAELLTRQKPISHLRVEEDRNLANYFVRSIEEETLSDILDPQWVSEASIQELVFVASIAERCLRLSGRERPTMKEVYVALQGVQKLNKTEHTILLDQNYHVYNVNGAGTETTMVLDKERDLYPISSEAETTM